MAGTNKSHYISAKESRRIARENIKITKKFEKNKKRKIPESAYLTEMKDGIILSNSTICIPISSRIRVL